MSARQRQEARKQYYKPKIDADESRRRREENTVEIRKSKRDESLSKRRNLVAPKKVLDASIAQKVNCGFNKIKCQNSLILIQLENLPAMISGVQSNDPVPQLEA